MGQLSASAVLLKTLDCAKWCGVWSSNVSPLRRRREAVPCVGAIRKKRRAPSRLRGRGQELVNVPGDAYPKSIGECRVVSFLRRKLRFRRVREAYKGSGLLAYTHHRSAPECAASVPHPQYPSTTQG